MTDAPPLTPADKQRAANVCSVRYPPAQPGELAMVARNFAEHRHASEQAAADRIAELEAQLAAAQQDSAALEAEAKRLRDALRVAGFRLARGALEMPHDSAARYELNEWAEVAEAIAALDSRNSPDGRDRGA